MANANAQPVRAHEISDVRLEASDGTAAVIAQYGMTPKV